MRFPLSLHVAIKKGLELFTCVLFFATSRNSNDVPMERYDFARLIVTIFSGSWPGAVEKEASLLARRKRAPQRYMDG